ncbi:MAG: glycosyltransferase [Acetobacter papayae]
MKGQPGAGGTVVMFSTADWAAPCWTNKQHIARRLAERGYTVLYIETVGLRRPSINSLDLTRIIRRLRSGLKPPRRVGERLWVLSPLTLPLGQRHGFVRYFNAWILRTAIRLWLRRHGDGTPPLVWTYHPYMLEAISGLKRSALVYHCVDNIAAVPGVDATAFAQAEEALLARADAVFTTAPALQAHCARIAPHTTHYFPNVADLAHFAQARHAGAVPPELAAIAGPRLGFIGTLTDFKVDFALLEHVALARPDWHLVVIGDEREGQADPVLERMRRLDNVHMLGWRPYAVLPDYLRGLDVALLPLLLNDHTRAVFPMKFFEYLAAGCPVVATSLPALADFSSYCRLTDSAEAFMEGISNALTAPQVIPENDPVLMENNWDTRLDKMLAVLGPAAARAG